MPDIGAWGAVLWMLVCVVAVIGLAYWFTRFVVGRGLIPGTGRQQGGKQMEILSQQTLGKDQRIAVVRVGTRYFLVGIAANSISTLAELTEEDIICAQEPSAAPQDGQLSFREALDAVIKNKMRR